jgi:hypothetical protein
MSKKIKITEEQLKRLVSNKNRIQEQNESYVKEEIDESSKEEYFARHGEDTIGWTGSSNKIYGDLPDGDYDDETYDDFDTLHGKHPDFHRHYTGGGGPERAKEMFNIYKHKHGPLRMKKIKQMDTQINESIQKIKSNFKRFL